MELQLSNFVFIFSITLATFIAFAVILKITFPDFVNKKHISFLVGIGLSLALYNGFSSSMPKNTLTSIIPEPSTSELVVKPMELIPKRDIKEWQDKIDKFDSKQDKRIIENSN